ncbi:hypothetical protein [Pseudomonas sp. GM55]|uniref:hypothetical protein n=1 Tax=Pseudomonas sp. GM55 TaxID=1144333 RepID=UPI00027066E9|nr:hypothetical protein [Pseudomonas sp. GM55]EJM78142.1 hypothetical protein PMI31_00535 [Pseudomonas sp. GM55]
MDTESKQHGMFSRDDVFWWGCGSLEKRLSHVLGHGLDEYSISTRDLESNASFVNYYAIITRPTSPPARRWTWWKS